MEFTIGLIVVVVGIFFLAEGLKMMFMSKSKYRQTKIDLDERHEKRKKKDEFVKRLNQLTKGDKQC